MWGRCGGDGEDRISVRFNNGEDGLTTDARVYAGRRCIPRKRITYGNNSISRGRGTDRVRSVS